MVMDLDIKVRGGKGSPMTRRGQKGKGGKAYAALCQMFASKMAITTLSTMKKLTPVDTGLTRQTTFIFEGEPHIPVERSGGSVKGSVSFTNSVNKQITAFGDEKKYKEFTRLPSRINRNYHYWVGPTTDYASYVNEGTRNILARRWIEATHGIANANINRIAAEVFGPKNIVYNELKKMFTWMPIKKGRRRLYGGGKR